MLGTLLGGWLAYGLESGSRNGVFLGCMALLVAYTGYFVGYSADLKYGIGKLFTQAFVIGEPAWLCHTILHIAHNSITTLLPRSSSCHLSIEYG